MGGTLGRSDATQGLVLSPLAERDASTPAHACLNAQSTHTRNVSPTTPTVSVTTTKQPLSQYGGSTSATFKA
jgi:hypothetical protein